MKKSIITMCIAALAVVCNPLVASENNNTPPVKQEFQIVKESDLAKNENPTSAIDKTEASVNGQETSTAQAHDGGYIVISSAGLILLIILLIILL